ncbi:MAG: hypothetical protein V4736_03555 [Bdellovibrionota bacterium]
MMYPIYVKLFDAFLNLLGAFGLMPILRTYFGQTHLNPLEKKIRWIFLTIFSLFTLRVFHLGFGLSGITRSLIFLLSLGILFSVFLYCETLLRRHFPIWLKYFALAGFIFFFVGLIFGVSQEIWFTQIFFIYIVLIQVFSLSLCIFRNRADYSRMENTLINRNIVALIFIPMFFISDLVIFNIPVLPKMGVLGGLLMGYISLYSGALFKDKAMAVRNLIFVLVTAFGLAFGVTILARTDDPYFMSRIMLLFVCLYLAGTISLTVMKLESKDDITKFILAIIEADKKSILGFLKGVNSFFSQVDRKILRSSDLEIYNETTFQDTFAKCQTHLLSIFDIQSFIQLGPSDDMKTQDLEKLEKLKDMLEKNEMTYICQVGISQAYYILFNVPLMGYDSLIRIRTKLLVDVADLIEK